MCEPRQALLQALTWCKDNAEVALTAFEHGDIDEVQACLVAIVGDCERTVSIYRTDEEEGE